MERSTDYLRQILHVVGSIEQTMRQGKGSGAGPSGATGSGGVEPSRPKTSIFKGVGLQLKEMFSVNYKKSKGFFDFTEKLLNIADKTPDKNIDKLKIIVSSFDGLATSLPKLARGLQEMGKLKSRRINMALNNLGLLYDFMYQSGDARKIKRVNRSLKMFSDMGMALRDIAKPIKTISNALITISIGIVAFAASLLLAGKLLGAAGAGGVILGITGVILGLVMVFGVLALAKKAVKEGQTTLREIGTGMMFLSLGIVSFALVINILPKLLNTDTVITGVLMVAGIIVMTGLLFAGIGLLDKWIEKGVGVAVAMGVGMMALAAGTLVFALVARLITGMGDDDAVKRDGTTARGKFGQAFAGMGGGLGIMGIILVGSALLFAGMGVLAPVLLPGIGIGIGMAIALITLAGAIKKVSEVAADMDPNFKTNLSDMITGLIGGVVKGLSKGLMGGEGVSDASKLKFEGFFKLNKGLRMLRRMSRTVSLFAEALTAFATVDNMRVIEGYDEDGKPKFGGTVNISTVSDNIAYSIKTFLTSLRESTTGLSKKEAKAIKKMGRALTGRRGILSAVIQFASVLKTFAQFGPEGKIGFVDMVPDGEDEDGNAKFKEVASTVLISEVVNSIIDSFGLFVTKISSHAGDFGVKGKHGRQMNNLAEALLGKKGIGGIEKYGLLQPINAFADTLMIYSKFGADNMIPNIDADGKVVGDPIPVETVADNIMSTLGAFTDALGSKQLKKDTKAAENNLKVFDNIIDRTNKIAKSIDGLSRLSATLTELATSIGLLSNNLIGLDVSKIAQVSDIGSAYLAKTNDYSVSNQRIMEGYNPSGPSATATPASAPSSQDRRSGSSSAATVKEPNWDLIAAQIGESVGSQIVGAMKTQQMKFTFSSTGGNQGVIEFD